MKRILKVTLPTFLVIFLSTTMITQGAFQVEVGETFYFKIKKASTSVKYDYLEETFTGVKINQNTILPGEVITVNVTQVTENNIQWEAIVDNVAKSYTTFSTVSIDEFRILLAFFGSDFWNNTINIDGIYESGEINPAYLDPFLVPPILDSAPVTWDTFTSLIVVQRVYIGFVDDCGASCDDDEGKMVFNWWYTFNVEIPDLATLSINSDTTIIYDMVTGILAMVDSSTTVIFHYGYPPNHHESETVVEYNLEKTTKTGNIANFLSEYKWYIIGGGAGLGAVILITITVLVIWKKKK